MHPYSFLFQYIPSSELTLSDLETATNLGKIRSFPEFELLAGKLFDNMEQMLSDMHGQMLEEVEKAKIEFVEKSVQSVVSGLGMLTGEERQRVVSKESNREVEFEMESAD